MTKWHRSESRTARPFFAVAGLADMLKYAEIYVSNNPTPQDEDTIYLDDDAFNNLRLTISPRIGDANFSCLGRHTEKFSLVVSIRDTHLRRRKVLFCAPLDGDMPERVDIEREVVREFGHGKSLGLTLAIIMTAKVNGGPGWPVTVGSWVSRRDFLVKHKSVRSSFDIVPMSREEAKDWTGYAGALVHVDITDSDFNAEMYPGGKVATVYLAESVYENAFGANGDRLQDLLSPEIIQAVVLEASEEIMKADDVTTGSPLERVLHNLDAQNPMKLEDLKQTLKNPEKLRALVHHSTNYVTNLGAI